MAETKRGRKRHKPGRPKKSAVRVEKERPKETVESLLRQKEEIEVMLASIEDAFSDASLLEEDYNDIKSRNQKKLAEISARMERLKSESAQPSEPEEAAEPDVIEAAKPAKAPAIQREEIRETIEEAVKAPGQPSLSQEDLQNLQAGIVGKFKELVEGIQAQVTEKDIREIRDSLSKFQIETERLKAVVDTIRETRKAGDERLQTLVESIAEMKSLIYQREAAQKDQEVRLTKMNDVVSQVDPEKIIIQVSKRDRELSELRLKLDKADGRLTAMNEMMSKVKEILENVGSLEKVVTVSRDVAEKLSAMQNMENSVKKFSDKIQGIYVELSNRMEEFTLYKTKQDRMDDLINELLRTTDELQTKMMNAVTRTDLDSFKSALQATLSSSQASAGMSEVTNLNQQKDEILMLMKSAEEEFRGKSISKEEYRRMKDANLSKLREIEERVKKAASEPSTPQAIQPQTTQIKPAAEAPATPKEIQKTSAEKEKSEEPEEIKTTPKKRNTMPVGRPKKSGKQEEPDEKEDLLKDLEDSYRKGLISREAFEKTRKMLEE